MPKQSVSAVNRKRFKFLRAFSTEIYDAGGTEKAIGYLRDDYSALVQLSSNLGYHGRWIPYPFLATRLKKIGDELRAQADKFRARLLELGEAVPQINIDGREDAGFRENIRRLVGDMEEHAARYEIMVHQKNSMDSGRNASLLDEVASVMLKQKDELLDIVMKLS